MNNDKYVCRAYLRSKRGWILPIEVLFSYIQ